MSNPWEDPKEELKDLLRSLSERLSGGRGGQPPNLFEVLRTVALVTAAFSVVALGFSAMYTVEPSEEAVILRLGRYAGTQPPGLHFKLPFLDRAVKVRTKVILQEEFGFRSAGMDQRTEDEALQEESLTLTGDLNVANVEWIVQYQISDPKKFLFNTREVLKNLRDISQSVMRRVVGDRTVNEVLTVGRVEIGEEAHRLTQELLDRYDVGLRIVNVKLQNVNPPQPVRPAFNEVNAAKQEQEKAINQAEREYNKVIPEARGKAEQAISDAQGYATAAINRAEGDASRFRSVLAAYQASPSVTKTRLYLETMEELYARFRALTIVDKGVQGLLPVFPQGRTDAAPGQAER